MTKQNLTKLETKEVLEAIKQRGLKDVKVEVIYESIGDLYEALVEENEIKEHDDVNGYQDTKEYIKHLDEYIELFTGRIILVQ